MKMRLNFYLFFFLLSFQLFAQEVPRPKLVVGLVVDQMRWDYLYRYYDRYSNGGFKRLLREGFSCENAFIPYTPSHTGAGHASIFTGSVPALNGLMGNNWYDKQLKRVVYCTEDISVQTVGSPSVAGKMSPKNLWSNTITDELRLATNFKNKTIAIALKDRGSILPGGHSSNGTYWFDNATGGWISSSFYMKELPQWVKKVNDKKWAEQYLKQGWNTLYPINTYTQSSVDSNAYEGKVPSEDLSFPHQLSQVKVNPYESFRYTPGGTTLTFDMAKAAIEGEQLGARNITDFLTVSFSSPDYIGHAFGPNSIEIEDAYLRLDLELADFLTYLDKTIGKNKYLLFLTADHGAAHNPFFLRDNKLPGGSFEHTAVRKQLNDSLISVFHTRNIVAQFINYQVYLDDSVIRQAGLNKQLIKQYISEFLIKYPGVSNVIDLSNLANITLNEKLKTRLTNGYNHKLSGDIQVIYQPQWSEGWRTGTTHGQWNPYDTHIPLLWFGWKIKKGSTNREVQMTDIAATLAGMLHIQMPNACVGEFIDELKF